MSTPRPVILCILDGWGLSAEETGNAPLLAETPNMDRLFATCPNATLVTHGSDVGLPDGQMGNSEVGHTNIGAGRVVWMDLPKIDNAIADGSFATNAALQRLIAKLQETGGTAHLAGLVSPGGVHAHMRHVAEAARVIVEAGVPVTIHAFTDGRDVAPKSAREQLYDFEEMLPDGARVGSIVGRFYAMDRDNRWDRVESAYNLIRSGVGEAYENADTAIAAAYDRGETDEFIAPSCLDGYAGMSDGDGLLFLNFRADRAREILAAFLDPDFDGFAREPVTLAAACGTVEYSDRHNAWMDVMFPSEDIPNTLGAWVAGQGKQQFRIAETEKYPHVTFFLNGGVETPNEGEARTMPKSPDVRTYDMKPEMSSVEVTDKLVDAISSAQYDLIVVNYANPDMVGHTGDLDAAMAACHAVDAGLGRVLSALEDAGGAMIVIADHGNCETMIDPDSGEPHTAHTLNPVPIVLVGGPENVRLAPGRLADVAPTILQLMDLAQPDEMTGKSLILS
ncbi:2,3-bisphosphoglycerate-independent phosphoglycerate mutase [Pontivivens insulae]|uniref:2,3-bisphosphoglycerate-independent phosphoglycerate mutase n=1 Tax=Pontivivens insulae TaxID=1639689 RepID=A0A2R8AG42_9RHOB|nr:2,3-bisphosphoglycerate-independent phosphoglycerate mutase [Pontivivens insulae]RED12258.1 phosphoglycerate mutase [Pontivivens insulae]SPF31015.1 2,3-bisphosphoglycerate-independent phosphoglycerate mutase [Pontivivens insulae]